MAGISPISGAFIVTGEWTVDRPYHGHKTEGYGMSFAKPIHVKVEEARLSEAKLL
jgi:hypothetical protein